jgi:hypothetical protein
MDTKTELAKELDVYIKEKHSQDRCTGYIDGFEKAAEIANKNAVLRSVSNSASKKGTGTYMIVMTLISALCACLVGYGFKSLDAAITVGLFINIALCGAIRFNQ